MATPGKIIPVAKEGYPFILIFLVIGVLTEFISHPVSYIVSGFSFLLALQCIYFFRDPERKIIVDESFVLSPADGKIMEIGEEDIPVLGGKVRVIKIFLSIFNVHVQRSPLSGRISSIEYKIGKFLDARDKRAAIENEQNHVYIENEKVKIMVKQIAGLIARRIVCWVKKGDNVAQGERLGLIRFGSQVDIYLPLTAKVCVAEEDVVEGGLSVLAVLNI